MSQGANNPANTQLVKGAGCGTRQWNENFNLTQTDGVTPYFQVAQATGNTTVGGTLSVTGAISATGGVSGAVAATTISASGLITSTVAAGSPALKVVATNATPTVTWTSSSGTTINSTAPSGYLQIVVGSTPFYIPYWA